MKLPQPTRQGIFTEKTNKIIIKSGIKGYAIHEEEGHFLRQQAQSIHNGNILEIGSFHGLSMSYMQDVCLRNRNNIWSIDIRFFKEFYENIKKWNIEDIIHVIIGDSTKVHSQLQNNFYDLIFIDAKHDYTFIKLDIENYWPKLKINGLMIGHDYNLPGVKKAVNEKFKIKKIIKKIWWIKKWTQKCGSFPCF